MQTRYRDLRYTMVGTAYYLLSIDLWGGSDFRQSFDEIALAKPIIGTPVRSYADCVEYVGNCSLSPASFDSMKVGCKYLIHADGKKPSLIVRAWLFVRMGARGFLRDP